ncbi:PAS domain S-box protein [Bacillus tianshenii]|nr:PAS domain S-box protein [Bacillus tianshenii]
MFDAILNPQFVGQKEISWFLSITKDAFFIIDDKGKIQLCNPAVTEILGYSSEELEGQFIYELFPSPLKETVLENLTKVVGEDTPFSFPSVIIGEGGSCIRVKWNMTYNKKAEKLIVVLQEMSPKESSSDLISDKYEPILKHAEDAIDILDIDGKALKVNKEFERLYGWTNEEVQGMHLPIIPSHLQDEFQVLKGRVLKGERIVNHVTFRQRKDGAYFPISLTISPLYDEDKICAFLATTRDITYQRNIEEELLKQTNLLDQTNQRLEQIIESILDGFFAVDTDWNFIYVNHILEEIWGIRKEKLVGENIWELFPSIVGTIYEEKYRSSMKTKNPLRFKAYSEGLKKHYEICTFPFHDGLAVHIRDIHEQQVTLEKLQESEENIRQITENTKEVFCIHKADHSGVVYLSPAYENIWGVPVDSISYNDPTRYIEMVHPEDQEKYENFRLSDATSYQELEYRIVRPDKQIKWVRWRRHPAYQAQNNEKRVISICEDITELKEKELLLSKWDKLGVVGELAAGIAHEIRNPLTAIKGFIQLIDEQTKGQYTRIILGELERIESIINEFLLLAKPHQEMQFQNTHIHDILNEVRVLLEPEALLHSIRIDLLLGDHLPIICCESKQLKQVFINIMKNAIEAMSDGGTIKISSEIVDEEFISVKICDEGIGMPKERISKLGEPFFSNKEKGTGLGLMVSFKIIENHGGFIQFESEEGKGTEVDIRLPVSSARCKQ